MGEKAKCPISNWTNKEKGSIKENTVGIVEKQENLYNTLFELIRRTSTEIPDDVGKVILESLKREEEKTTAKYALDIIRANMDLAKKKSQPLCQDTGTIIFYVNHSQDFCPIQFTNMAHKAVKDATSQGLLRQNSVDILTNKNDSLNVGPGQPDIHFHRWEKEAVEISLMLKGGGCENVGNQYALPYTSLNAERDFNGVRKVILHTVQKAGGQGCGPGVLGVCIGGDRSSGYAYSKQQFLRHLGDKNPIPLLAELEEDIVETSNKLGIGPMGFGGKTTLLGCKIGVLNRLPASYFVSVSYMCWAYRRLGVILDENFCLKEDLY